MDFLLELILRGWNTALAGTLIIGLVVTVYLIVPAVFVGQLILLRKGNLATFLTVFALGIFVLGFLYQIFPGSILGMSYRPAALIILLLTASIILVTRQRASFLARIRKPSFLDICAAVLVIGALPAVVLITSGKSAGSQQPVKLANPVPNGRIFVAQGGNSALLNHHHRVRAQRYALDLAALNLKGRRAVGLMPTKLDDYTIYGMQVVAPCAGEVVIVGTGAPEQAIGTTDTNAPAGNFVALTCDETTIVLAHLKGAPLVDPGQPVSTGDALGYVGNSGNTTEPHLHIHAVKGSVQNLEVLLFGGDPVPIEFEGHQLKRNDLVPMQLRS